jgi:hypothetical protein
MSLERYQEEYSENQTHNATTRKALENVKNGKGLKKENSVEGLFKT